ncbi:TPA: hypothetical protein R7S05_001994 [Acinetobacter baumannii]|uniref:hypothetical protein n=1 Tax=Acinetobacter calcoaceticus/baumannii complex TaxID=909768 RepID=UPI0007EE4C2F|nr:hypothetical protein [Acinetobacter baumannii]EKV2135099.1 hypothetical protein [Acinetobacter baumannii]MCJ9255131.1 hypothetical protein [Acinetobacter baumannii]MCO1653349.1 hypothetical protein [Acinetobacter baumannii]MCR0009303.1 hypothetical protein [Acinetobacter baumannii]MDI7709059.1 hypothetical protein [Acinetobacter baumannii]
MFNNIKVMTGLEWAEFTTVILVLGVGYPFLSKLGFYNRLGVNWYINTGNAFSIFLSSISVIFWMLLGFAFSYISYRGIILIKNQITRFLVVTGIAVILLILISIPAYFLDSLSLKVLNFLLKINYVGIVISLAAFYFLLQVLVINADLRDFPTSNDKKGSQLPIYAIIIILISGFLSWVYGGAEADKVWKYRNQILNSVSISDSKEKWYLVDYSSDKALLLKDGNGLIFKIVEYKEIKQIMPPEQKLSEISDFIK